jgi:hypothetical protein
LQEYGQSLLGAVGGGDEGVQSRQFQETAESADPGGAIDVKDQMQGEDETAEEVLSGGAFAEGGEVGVTVGVLRTLEPVLQCRAWHTVLACKGSLGARFVIGTVKSVQSLGDRDAVRTAGLWPWLAIRIKLRKSHGSCSPTAFLWQRQL